jgi:DNA-binding SARP family transcriptional activator/predicted ATPase
LAFLGGFRAVIEDTAVLSCSHPITDFASAKTQALLAYLACTRQRHTRDALAAMFWGETSDEAAKTSLRQSLANLKKLAEPYLLIEREAVEFDTHASYALDVQDFELGARGDLNAQRDAISRYKGDLLKGLVVKNAPEFEEWLVVERERLRQLAANTLRHLAHAEAQTGEMAQAITYLQSLVALDPLDEPAHRQLMLLLARNGQRAAALAQFEACKRALDKELGVLPEEETTQLHERIRRAQHVINLPAETTPLIGREGELKKLSQWLADPACRLITVTGLGGAGKTRLAIRTARDNAARFLQGVCFASLATVEDEVGLVTNLLVALNAPSSGNATAGQHLHGYLRDKEVLLVLDSAEHLIEPCATLLTAVLKDAPGVKCVVASRERLNLKMEWTLALDGLPSGDEASPGVRLFQQAASRASGNECEASPSLARICQRLQGLPLAIELAAPWTRMMPIAQVEAELMRDLALLSTTMRDVDDRHRSLRAVFDQSWRLLSSSESRVLAALSIFRGGFTADAARAVAGASSVVMAHLADQSWLQRPADTRFDLHELVRNYAHDQLPDDERDAVFGRHCEYYANWLADREPLRRSARQKEVADELRAEWDNIRLMWQTAVRAGYAEVFDKATACVFWICDVLGRQQEGIRMFAEAATSLKGQSDCDATKGRLILRRGVLARLIGRFDEAEALLTQAEAMLCATDDMRNHAYALCQLGIFPVVRGDVEAGLARFAESLRLYRAAGDLRGVSDALQSLGIAEARRGRFERAQQMYKEAVDILAELGDEMELAVALNNLGDVAYYRGQLDHALAHQRAAVEIQRRYDDRRNLAISLNNMSNILCDVGQWDEALDVAQESADLFRDIGGRDGLMNASHSIAAALLGQGDVDRAFGHFNEVMALALQLNADAEVLSMLVLGAKLLHARGRDEDAARVLISIKRNPVATAYAADNAKVTLQALPPEIVRCVEDSGQLWTTQQMADILRDTV